MNTRKTIRTKVEGLQQQGVDISVEYANGGLRCMNRDESRNLSPRLSTSEMAIWLHGFQTALLELGDKNENI